MYRWIVQKSQMLTVTSRLKNFLATKEGHKGFLEHEVKGFLRELGIPVPRGVFIAKGERIPSRLELDIPYPLVAKVASARIVSKSDVGGVRQGLMDGKELQKAIVELMEIDQAEGVLIEESAPTGVEVIIGAAIDPQFGPIVMFGLGGVFVELFRDVAFALAPLAREEAVRLVGRTKGEKVLKGFRGKPPVDMEALTGIMITVSELIASGLLEEIDLNPVTLYPTSAMVLDAKLKWSETSGRVHDKIESGFNSSIHM